MYRLYGVMDFIMIFSYMYVMYIDRIHTQDLILPVPLPLLK
jgi:hypothetical protein